MGGQRIYISCMARRHFSSFGNNHTNADIEEVIAESGILGSHISDRDRLVTRLTKGPLVGLIIVFSIIAIVYVGYILFLTTNPRFQYDRMLYRNRLASEIVFAPRGAIIDRNGKQIVSSIFNPKTTFYDRAVADIPGIGTLIGFVRYPEKDDSGYYWRLNTEGASGLEKFADSMLRDSAGYRLRSRERSENESQVAEDRVVYPRAGEPLRTTLDSDLNRVLGTSLQEFITTNNYEGGAALVMNIATGQLHALVSLPDIDPDALSRGDDGVYQSYLADPRKPLLNRAIFGGYSPGSTVKPYFTLAFLNEHIITPETTILSTGSIKIINPYTKGLDYTFRDWRERGHGLTNARWALADSVNSFYYTFGGGYGNYTGLGIKKLKEYAQEFGLGEDVPFILPGDQPGQIPDPAWKWKTFKETWRLGDTYNSAIGQYGFVVTPLQQLRAVAALASSGLVIEPQIIQGKPLQVDRVSFGVEERWYNEVRAGMRDVVMRGTGQSMNVPEIEFAAKTGTSQVANKTKINSWVIGFWPYQKPEYAFVLLAERGPKTGAPNVSHAWKNVIRWMIDERTEYFIPAPGYEDVKQSPKKSTKVIIPEPIIAPEVPESDDIDPDNPVTPDENPTQNDFVDDGENADLGSVGEPLPPTLESEPIVEPEIQR
jgi:penicillin-binding protein 2